MIKKKKTKKRILEAAIQEFASKGYGGARIDSIAEKAQVNKAMIFYYYSSKMELYKLIVKKTIEGMQKRIFKNLFPFPSPEKLIEVFPKLYIEYFAENTYLIKIIGHDLITNPENITTIVREAFSEKQLPKTFIKVIKKWHEQGKIREDDPANFILNLVSPCITSFLALPIMEAVTNKKIEQNKEYYNKRIKSITNLLKGGILK